MPPPKHPPGVRREEFIIREPETDRGLFLPREGFIDIIKGGGFNDTVEGH
jgi:hypothetical protein